MSKQNRSGRGTQGATPAQETQAINTPVVETSTLVSAVIGDVSKTREERGDAQINESPLLSNINNSVVTPFASIKRGDITFNGSADCPVYKIVVQDGFVKKYVSGVGYLNAIKTLELNGSQLDELMRQRKNRKERKSGDPQFNDSWYPSTASTKVESVHTLKLTDELRGLIVAALEIAFRGKKVADLQIDEDVKKQIYVEQYDREIVRLLVPVGFDTFETLEARIRPIIDATLPRVDFPTPPVKEVVAKQQTPKQLEAQAKRDARAAKKAEKAKTKQTVTPGVESLDTPKPEALIPTPELI